MRLIKINLLLLLIIIPGIAIAETGSYTCTVKNVYKLSNTGEVKKHPMQIWLRVVFFRYLEFQGKS